MSKSENKSNAWTLFYIPYLVFAAMILPLYLAYCQNLWSKLPHYQFFPFLLLAVGYLIYDRWPRGESNPLRNSVGSPIFLGFAVFTFVAGLIFSESTFIALALALGMSSFLLRIKDTKTGGSLFPISLLLFIIIHAPFGQGYDGRLITALQLWSSQITSIMLDTIGILHDMPGTVLKTPDKEWGVEEACSGVQSFFTLVFCASLWAIWNRRPWFRGGLLVLSTIFWAVAMNTIRIFSIPVAYYYLNHLDLSEGWSHAVLGYTTLILGILMVISTDQLLEFLFGPVEIDQNNAERQSTVLALWNRFIAGGTSFESSGDWTPTFPRSIFRFAGVGVSVLCFLYFFPTIYTALTTSGYNFMGSSSNVIRIDNQWVPQKVGDWRLIDSSVMTRKIGSDLGQRSNTWIYTNGNVKVTFGFDQAFPGWHELTTCYKNSAIGWKVSKDQPRIRNQEDGQDGNSWIEVGLNSPTTGGYGVLLFGHDSSSGKPLDAPEDWSFFTSTWRRLMNRLSPQVRGQLFSGVAYQSQLFSTYGRFPGKKHKKELRNLYNELRRSVQTRLSQKRIAADYMTNSELEDERREQLAKQQQTVKSEQKEPAQKKTTEKK